MVQKASILMSFLGLWISSYLSNNQEFFIGFTLILSFGILHGANDFLLIEKLKLKEQIKSKLLYLLSIVLFCTFFYNYPNLCFISFIITSSFHFGEQHYIDLEIENEKYHLLLKFIMGFLILSLLFVNNTIPVLQILKDISTLKLDENILYINLICSAFMFILFMSKLIYQKKINLEKIFQFLISIIVLVIIFKTSSLIWGFTIYFIFWHSIPSMIYQIKYIYSDINFKNFKLYTQNAIIYWILAIIFLFFYFFYFNKTSFFITAFFTFISAITFPHTFVIVKMFKAKNKEKD
jgi:Brp/Blh family beta-carotene 15,15'-monooxygenase